MKELIECLNKSLIDSLGDLSKFGYSIDIKNSDNRIFISLRIESGQLMGIYTIITDNESVILDKMKFKSLDFFNEYSKQIVDTQIIPDLKMYYVKKFIPDLPEFLKTKSNTKFSIDLDWLKNTFHEISEQEGNSEIIENIKVSNKKDKINITFDVDCGRYGLHRENKVEINDRGYVQVYLCGPLDGSGVEYELANKIRSKINNN